MNVKNHNQGPFTLTVSLINMTQNLEIPTDV